jgi:hypothetical protein
LISGGDLSFTSLGHYTGKMQVVGWAVIIFIPDSD